MPKSNNLRRYFFLLRWFIIGKYHCYNLSNVSRKMFMIIHKMIWLFILYSVMCTIHMGVEWLAIFL